MVQESIQRLEERFQGATKEIELCHNNRGKL